MGKSIRQPELRSRCGAPFARAEKPHLRSARHFRRNFDAAERMLRRKIVVKKRQKFGQLLGEVRCFQALTALSLQRERFQSATSRSAPKAEIDTTWIQRVQHAENFGHFERTVMRKQHSTGADANFRSFGRHSRD